MISHDAALTDAALLALHRDMVATPSVSGSESTLCTALLGFLGARGIDGTRHGDNLFVVRGPVGAPVICLNSHLDTVPPSPGWTRAPHEPVVEAGRVYGLGSNDAKAAGAAMVGAFLRLLPDLNRLGVRVLLALTAQEEVGGKGAEALVPELERRGLAPPAVRVGEQYHLQPNRNIAFEYRFQ